MCIWSSFATKRCLIRSMSELRPLTKSSQGGMDLKAVIAKLSDLVKATKGKPCLDAGRKRAEPRKFITTPSLMHAPSRNK